jgi:hypothetical protein
MAVISLLDRTVSKLLRVKILHGLKIDKSNILQ